MFSLDTLHLYFGKKVKEKSGGNWQVIQIAVFLHKPGA